MLTSAWAAGSSARSTTGDECLAPALLTALVPSLGQSELDGSLTPDAAFELLDYAFDRVLRV